MKSVMGHVKLLGDIVLPIFSYGGLRFLFGAG